MVDYIKLTLKMRRIVSTFVLAVVILNVLITSAIMEIQYASATEDASSADLECKQSILEDKETITLEDSLYKTTEEQFTYDDEQQLIISAFNTKEDTLVVLEENSEVTEKTTEVSMKNHGGLLNISNPDINYTRKIVSITGDNRDKLERLVMGEAGGEGFEGAALVAQAIKDTMILEDEYSVVKIKDAYDYCADFSKTPNEDTLDAVRYVFDEGGYAVKHRLIYFYAPRWVKNNWSRFHESQNFIIQHKGHKFFDRTF